MEDSKYIMFVCITMAVLVFILHIANFTVGILQYRRFGVGEGLGSLAGDGMYKKKHERQIADLLSKIEELEKRPKMK
jgi:hypothetical protein